MKNTLLYVNAKYSAIKLESDKNNHDSIIENELERRKLALINSNQSIPENLEKNYIKGLELKKIDRLFYNVFQMIGNSKTKYLTKSN